MKIVQSASFIRQSMFSTITVIKRNKIEFFLLNPYFFFSLGWSNVEVNVIVRNTKPTDQTQGGWSRNYWSVSI